MIGAQWQIGLHIQPDSVISVALTPKRGGWRQQRWWALPLAPYHDDEQRRQALIEALTPWRAQLPRYSSIRLGFPAQRTLQRELPVMRTGMRSLAWRRRGTPALSAARRAGVRLYREPGGLCRNRRARCGSGGTDSLRPRAAFHARRADA